MLFCDAPFFGLISGKFSLLLGFLLPNCDSNQLNTLFLATITCRPVFVMDDRYFPLGWFPSVLCNSGVFLLSYFFVLLFHGLDR